MRKLVSALTVPTGLALLVVPVQAQDAPSSQGLSVSRSATSPGQDVTVAKDGTSGAAVDGRQLGRVPPRVAARRTAVTAFQFTGAEILPGVVAGAGFIVAGGLLLLGIRYRRGSA
jgi:hypothetical protein